MLDHFEDERVEVHPPDAAAAVVSFSQDGVGEQVQGQRGLPPEQKSTTGLPKSDGLWYGMIQKYMYQVKSPQRNFPLCPF